MKSFLKRKNIEISVKRYLIDALGAMAQGLFCSLLIGTIINTIGGQLGIGFLIEPVATIAGTDYTVGGLAMAMSGPAMAIAIGYTFNSKSFVFFFNLSNSDLYLIQILFVLYQQEFYHLILFLILLFHLI